MGIAAKRKTSLTLDAALLDSARSLGINVSAVADTALKRAVEEVRRSKWLDENADAFAAQAEWHERNGHPLAKIIASPVSASWKG
ncbi:type II toxin-antitoxin system CcdA family antitoxin [Limimaricola cinnabarinus]|uniref:type II toxin-antitoxin system CcdA family antitoxin n=1 Tax=Limimaricola cinnabarinus TaxID=1125964 RepID=UPI002FE3D0B1